MENTIDGVAYNTAVATEVAHFSNGRSRSDPLRTAETLFLQKGGVWFLLRHREGKAQIIPRTRDEARDWLRNRGFIAKLVLHFGERVTRTTPATVL